ncbi:MAG: hypothetical protein LBS37_08850 [Treponema sp.]|jgi:hypothetical protein|nr:hypothetical protein [Treponema sp.]
MNINYHYFTVKTLARFAGLREGDAQYVAHFSQQVDDFIMNAPFVVKGAVPDFFEQNGLAENIGNNAWIFLPCPTGFNLLNEISHDYQRHAMMPFHFITPEPLGDMESRGGLDRSKYRCLNAEDKNAALINRLAESAVNEAKPGDLKSLMNLGMMFHTFADTYSHVFFSGLHGWENQAAIQSAEKASKEALSEFERLMFKTLPSIGHANAGHTPDICDYSITLIMKKNENERLEPLVVRNNSVFFTSCSKNILKMLSRANHVPVPDDFEAKLRQVAWAQTVNDEKNVEELTKSWSKAFPNIEYHYNKSDYFDFGLKIILGDKALMNSFEITEEMLMDIHSPEGDRGRAASILSTEEVTRDFFDYNELAYKRVYAVTGEYASIGRKEQIKDLKILIKKYESA